VQRKSAVATGRNALDAARTVLATAREKQLSFLAASIAYYMLVSLFPARAAGARRRHDAGRGPLCRAGRRHARCRPHRRRRGRRPGRTRRSGAGAARRCSASRSSCGAGCGCSAAWTWRSRSSTATAGVTASPTSPDALVALAGIGVAVVAVVAVTALVARSGVEVAGLPRRSPSWRRSPRRFSRCS